MVAYSKTDQVAFRGADLTLGLNYRPPEGESLVGMEISAALVLQGGRAIPASSVTFDAATGEISATWEEAVTANLTTDRAYEARFTRTVAGASRVFYVRRVVAR